VFAVSVSLFVAVTLTPALGARVMRREEGHGQLFAALEGLYSALESRYARILSAALSHRALLLGLALLSVVGAGLMARTIPLEFSPRADRSEFETHIELPLGTGIEATKLTAELPADGSVMGFSSEETTVFDPMTGSLTATIWVDAEDRIVRVLREYSTVSLDGDFVEAVTLFVFGDFGVDRPLDIPQTADAIPAPA